MRQRVITDGICEDKWYRTHNPQVPCVATCKRVARHCYPPGDLLLPFGQFTLCRAYEDKTACVAVCCLTLRIGGDMGALRAPLRQKKSSAVPPISKRSPVLWSAPDHETKGNGSSKRVETAGVYLFGFRGETAAVPLTAGAAIGYISPPTYNRSRGPLQYGSGPPANPQF